MQDINSRNYFMGTTANWKAASRPNRKPDYTSHSGSDYWYTETGVIRYSDHWGSEIASCNWYLDGEEQSSFDDQDGWRYGYAAWNDFTFGDYEITVYDSTGSLDFNKLGKPVRLGETSYVCETCPAQKYATYRIEPNMLADGMVHIGTMETYFDARYYMAVEY